MANKNKVMFGLSKLYVAKLIPPAEIGGIPTWDTPIAWPGAVNLGMDSAVEESTFWADNVRYWGTYRDNGYTGEVETALLIPEIAVMALGWMIDQHGGLLEVSNGKKNDMALLGQFEGDVHGARWVIYSCTAGKPSSEAATTEESTDPQTQSLPYTATPVQVLPNILATKYTLFDDEAIPEVHTAYNDWFKAVTLPVPVTEGGEG